ncbi:hypothetical protein I6F35_09620 [Bradyrhizobium sp. BRP22]|uniref:hypothetical protein n=1 Tax=Bradyrhizobium sp. BRP22 TaxID=2793821 RepID=UPI001CD4BB6F|nr:hypothetical protein [Bradyrhizobium sp. BRP22]MCA1453471.1 hypothetical protein [Bradyrhizobium sp. BRP22]
MPTVIRARPSVPLSRAPQKANDGQLVSIALFCGIGLLISLVAVMFGEQGSWH